MLPVVGEGKLALVQPYFDNPQNVSDEMDKELRGIYLPPFIFTDGSQARSELSSDVFLLFVLVAQACSPLS